ncbi:MAG: hypothetical protein V3U52_06025, partial [Thermoplasmata archaeon]
DATLPPSSTEEIYLRELRRFGAVQSPSPCFVEPLRTASPLGLECHHLVMTDEEFTDVFCKEVSGWELVRHSLHLKKLGGITFSAETPEEFAQQLDGFVNRFRGHRSVEETREAHISSSIAFLCSRGLRVLALVEREV